MDQVAVLDDIVFPFDTQLAGVTAFGVRAERFKVLERDDLGHWLIIEGREAYRCWRGDHTENYSEKNCP